MRKTSFSAKCSPISSVSSRAEARSWPNGFSTIRRVQPSVVRRSPSSLDEHRHRLRRDREVVDAVAARSAFLVELVQQVGELVLAALVGEVERDVAGRLGEPLPDLGLEVVAPELADRVLHLVAELVVRPLRAGGADDRELLGEELAARERVQRREDLAVREVAGGAEDDEHARLGRPPRAEPLEQRIRLNLRLGHFSLLTACPPNCWRRAASILAANDSSWREAKRA